MKRVGTFQSKRWGFVEVHAGNYGAKNGPLAIALINEGEPLATLSVNMYKPDCSHDSEDLPKDCFYVKQWSENAEIANEAMDSGLFKMRPDLPDARSGYVLAPVWQLINNA